MPPRSPSPTVICRSVLMVGADLEGRGGIRAVVQGYREGGLFERVPCVYVATHRRGSAWTKLSAAVSGWTRIALLLRTMEAPLLHVHSASRASFWRKSIVCLLARLAHRPYLLHVHGGDFLKFYEEECGAAARRIVRGVLGRAALVLALSEEWRARLARIAPGARIEVLTNAVALPAPGEWRAARDSRPTVLFLGDVSRRKGVHDLVRAFAAIAPRHPRARLVCAGEGALEDLRRLAERLGLSQRIACPGWLAAERKNAELAAATIFVLPSYAEGLPMALLEAMSFALPVIATPVGAIPQVISDGVNGLLVPAGDVPALAAALARLLGEPALRARLGAAARASIEARFSLESAIERLLALYGRFGIEARPARAQRADRARIAAGRA
jgi:glycosyltransferase involved in cell wall biosynthesis